VYAPTWEGTGGIDGYSSLLYGTRIIDALHREGFRVVYRPHPFTGIEDASYGRADTRVRDHVHRGGGRAGTEPGLQSAVAGAWALVSDVSGVVSSWLPSKRPLVVTSMTPAASRVDTESLTAALPRVAPEQIDQLGRRLREMSNVVDDDTLRYWLGDVSPGAPTAALLEACARVGDLSLDAGRLTLRLREHRLVATEPLSCCVDDYVFAELRSGRVEEITVGVRIRFRFDVEPPHGQEVLWDPVMACGADADGLSAR